MSVYKIFPEKDSSIYSEYITKNTGLDEILDISKYTNSTNTALGNITYETSRLLIKFPTDDVLNIYNTYIQPLSSSYKVGLKLFLADASEIPTNYTLITYPISQSWEMGTGRYSNLPITTNGVSWLYRNYEDGTPWLTSSLATGSSCFYSGSNGGGGTWYNTVFATQSFTYITEKDIDFDITNIYSGILQGTRADDGLIVFLSGSEFVGPSPYKLTYFSTDTNTIYPPLLELKWDDAVFSTGSSVYPITDNPDSVITITNNKGEYKRDSIIKFRVKARDRFPIRSFQTSSLYLNNKYLPATNTTYCIKDLDTDETIIDFDSNFTKLSADEVSNYFTLYTNGLQRERYYKILIKVIFSDGEQIIYDDNFYFKIK